MRSPALLLALLLPCAAVTALYSKVDAVLQLTGDTFDNDVVKADGVSVVEFYAPWCGHCKNLAPHYKTVAQKLKGIVTMAAVDCDEKANKKLCAQNGVKGFPTVKLFGAEKKKNPYTGTLYREAQDFQGASTAKGLMDAATGLLSSEHITRITSVEDFEKFALNRPGVAKVLLFTSKRDTPIMYKGLSMQLHRGLDFGEVHQEVADVVGMHEVQDFPTLMVLKAEGGSEVYDGDLKAPQVGEFLRGFASPVSEEGDAGADAGSEEQGSGKKGREPKAPEVRELSLEEAAELDQQEEMWLLGLYSPGEGADCADAVAQFKDAVTDMQDVVKAALVAVQADEVDQVSRYGASPSKLRSQGCTLQLVLLPFGEDKADAEDYSVFRGTLDGKSLQKWVTDATPSTFTTEVSASSFQYFASMPPPGAPEDRVHVGVMKPIVRFLLFTNKDEVPGVFKALATNHRSTGFGFGWVQSTQKQNRELMEQFQVTKVPKLVFITYVPKETPGGEESEDGRMTLEPSVGAYRGPMKYSGMATFVRQLAAAFAPKPAPEGAEAAAAAEKALPEISDDDGLESHCVNKGGICVLALLAPSQGDRHQQVKQRLGELSAELQRRSQPFHFAWVDGARFRGVAAAFRLLGSDLPSVVALSGKRMRYATLPAATEASGIRAFLDGVLSGKVRTEVLQELPSFVEGGADDAAPESEPAPEEAPVEEEFDLSDILSEEVEGSELASKGDRLKQVEEELKAEEEARKAAAKKSSKSKSKKKSKKSKSKSDKSEL